MIESALVKPAAPRAGALLANPSRDVDIVVPVYNEEAALEQSIRRLHRFLSESFPFAWRIVIADNASTDGTPAIARSLRGKLRGIEYLRLERKGRGRALRAAWSRSEARVVAYMDVDLSTDLRAPCARREPIATSLWPESSGATSGSSARRSVERSTSM